MEDKEPRLLTAIEAAAEEAARGRERGPCLRVYGCRVVGLLNSFSRA